MPSTHSWTQRSNHRTSPIRREEKEKMKLDGQSREALKERTAKEKTTPKEKGRKESPNPVNGLV